MDFDDLLMNVVLLFDAQPAVLHKYQGLYQHILVDEFQDTNTTQYEMLKRLAGKWRNIFAVGDSDQSIYKWRGADFRNINRFRDHYPDAQMILLEQNYRSTQIILDAAKAVIRRNKNRVDKELFTQREGGVPIEVREAYNEVEEADLVVSTIQRLMLEGTPGGECAVMYRTNAQSRVVEEAFLRAGMPYRLVGATRFYGRREIKDLIAYLRLIHNPSDSVSFGRVLNTPPRGIGAKTAQALAGWAEQQSLAPAAALVRLATDPELQHPFTGRSLAALAQFGQMLHDWMGLRQEASVGFLLDSVLELTDYRAYIDDGTEEGSDRWANVMEFRGVALLDEEMRLADFLEQVALVSEVDNLEETPNAPTLLRLHAAKGLVFGVVFITGVEEGMLPHSRSLDDPEELAEERRLFYVGITRARDAVYLTHAFRRTFFGETEIAVPSRFLQDIPAELTTGGKAGQRRQETKKKASSWTWSTPKASPLSKLFDEEKKLPEPSYSSSGYGADDGGGRPAVARYRTGQKVSHAKFGDGIVIESKATGNDEEVTVAFSGVGIKKLAASLAKLEIRDG
jgi:DNA helicase-2/ATP-dependent DNA helicase PcrA